MTARRTADESPVPERENSQPNAPGGSMTTRGVREATENYSTTSSTSMFPRVAFE